MSEQAVAAKRKASTCVAMYGVAGTAFVLVFGEVAGFWFPEFGMNVGGWGAVAAGLGIVAGAIAGGGIGSPFLMFVVSLFILGQHGHTVTMSEQAEQKAKDPTAYAARMQSNLEYDKRLAAEAKQARSRRTELCQIRAVCAQYPQARQDCATAGNFNNCLNVKVNFEHPEFVCTNDGNFISAPKDMPNAIQCAAAKLEDLTR